MRLVLAALLAGCPKSPLPPAAPAGPAIADETVVVEQEEAVDFDGDGVDELVQVELTQTESTASRYAAVYREREGEREPLGTWLLRDTIGGGEYAGMTSDEDGASHGCDPEPHDYVLRDGKFVE